MEANQIVRSRKVASSIGSEVGKEQMASSHHRESHPTETEGLAHRPPPLTTLAEGCHNKRHRVNDGQTGLFSET